MFDSVGPTPPEPALSVPTSNSRRETVTTHACPTSPSPVESASVAVTTELGVEKIQQGAPEGLFGDHGCRTRSRLATIERLTLGALLTSPDSQVGSTTPDWKQTHMSGRELKKREAVVMHCSTEGQFRRLHAGRVLQVERCLRVHQHPLTRSLSNSGNETETRISAG